MKYEITFNALNTKGEVMGARTFCITSSERLDIEGKTACLLRLCVEYARLTGIRCSLAEITDIDERLVGTKRMEGER